jgi:hypothetical protein
MNAGGKEAKSILLDTPLGICYYESGTKYAQKRKAKAMYKGRYIKTLTEEDMKHPTTGLWNLMGNVLPSDVGKQVWEQDGIFFVENDEQRDKRLAAHKPDLGRMDSIIGQMLDLTDRYNKAMGIALAELERAKKGVA